MVSKGPGRTGEATEWRRGSGRPGLQGEPCNGQPGGEGAALESSHGELRAKEGEGVKAQGT